MGLKERKRLEKQMRRSQILDAARSLLFSRGMDAISMAGIAEEAELGTSTLYFYFKNKEDIFVALQEEGLSILLGIIEQIMGQDQNPDQSLFQIAMAYYEFSQNQNAYFNIINYFLSASKVLFQADQKKQVDMAGHKILTRIQTLITDGMASGNFNEIDPQKFSVMFWGTLHGLLQFRKLEKTTLQDQSHEEIYVYSVQKLIQLICPSPKG